MFTLASVASFLRTVVVNVPSTETADALDRQEFVMRFRVLTDAEAKAFDRERKAMAAEDLAADPYALLRTVAIGWDGVVDGNGRAVPFSSEALAAMLELSWTPGPMLQAYYDGMAGRPRAGN